MFIISKQLFADIFHRKSGFLDDTDGLRTTDSINSLQN